MTSVNVFDFRNDLAAYLDFAQSGSSLILKRFNKPIAMLVPYDEKTVDVRKFYGFLGGIKETGTEYENRVRRSTKEKTWTKRYDRDR